MWCKPTTPSTISPSLLSFAIDFAFVSRSISQDILVYLCLFLGDVVLLLEQVAADLGLFKQLEISFYLSISVYILI